MSKRKLVVCVAVFNALIIMAFIFSNIYIWDFINNLTSQARHDSSGVVIPNIQINSLQVTGWIDAWTSEGFLVPTVPPASVPNYPFIVFWVAIVGNLILIALILRKHE
jgi:hypothetical protein